jgi:hypothetical protein
MEVRFAVGAAPAPGTDVTGAGSSWSGTRGSSLAVIPGCAALSATAVGSGTGGRAGCTGAGGVVGCDSGRRGGGAGRSRAIGRAVASFCGTYTIVTVLAADDGVSRDIRECRPTTRARTTAMAWAAALVSQYRGAVRASPCRSSCAFGGDRRRPDSDGLSRGSGSPRPNGTRCIVGARAAVLAGAAPYRGPMSGEPWLSP